MQEEYFYYKKGSVWATELVLLLLLLGAFRFFWLQPSVHWSCYALMVLFSACMLYNIVSYFIRRMMPALQHKWILKLDNVGITDPVNCGCIPWTMVTKLEYNYISNSEGLDHTYINIYITDAEAYYAYNRQHPIGGKTVSVVVKDQCIPLKTDIIRAFNKRDVFALFKEQHHYYTGIIY